MKTVIMLALLGLFAWFATPFAHADSPIARDLPPGLQIPDAARPGPAFDVDKATDAYLNLLSPEQRQLSNSYFEGGYWLQLWAFLYGLGVAALLLWGGISRRLRDIARRVSPRPWLYTWIYACVSINTAWRPRISPAGLATR